MEPERGWSMEALTAETRVDVRHLQTDLVGLRQDVQRLDDRLFPLLLLQVATLVTAFGSLVTALVAALNA